MIIILPCCWCPGKYVISNGYIVKDAGLDPVHSDMHHLDPDAVSEGPGTGTLICLLVLSNCH